MFVNGKSQKLHRLVAEAFQFPKTAEQTQVNHINGVRHDNRLENLEWTTQSANIQHSYDTNTNRASCATRKSKPVCARRVGGDEEEWVEYPNLHTVADTLGVDRSNIRKCLRGLYQASNGYEFKLGTLIEPLCLDGEEWRDVHAGARVSSYGRMQNTQGVVFTPKPRQDGYALVQVKDKTHLMHRLVAETFGLPRTPEQVQVNHINGDRGDNRLQNLEWVTQSANIQHSYDTNTTRVSCVATLARPIRGRKIGTEAWTVYMLGAADAARTLGLNHGNISECVTSCV